MFVVGVKKKGIVALRERYVRSQDTVPNPKQISLDVQQDIDILVSFKYYLKGGSIWQVAPNFLSPVDNLLHKHNSRNPYSLQVFTPLTELLSSQLFAA